MIPPEPEPEPPVPEPTSDYTYAQDVATPVGPYTAHFYTNIRNSQGTQCKLIGTIDGNSVELWHLMIVDVTAFDQINRYFCNADASVMVYSDNASVGGTHPYYRYDADNDDIVQTGTIEITHCIPSNYFEDIDSGNYTLEVRQTRGEEDESDLDYR